MEFVYPAPKKGPDTLRCWGHLKDAGCSILLIALLLKFITVILSPLQMTKMLFKEKKSEYRKPQ
jgi:hypothetical protein